MRLYLIYACCVLAAWVLTLTLLDSWHVLLNYWPAAPTMMFGSFIAGASAEGGGAIAYPVFTLLLKIPPDSARNFSFAIQSVGMVSASMLIIGRKIRIEWKAIVYPSIGGIGGLVLGTYFVVPLLNAVQTKLFFVSLWLAFGIGLWLANRQASRHVRDRLSSLARRDRIILILVGFGGGIITAIFGNGIDIFTFCVLTLWYGMNEKVATPTSVVLMSILTVAGFLLHSVVKQDFGPLEWSYWMAAIPVAAVFAPLGAWAITYLHRLQIARILYAIIAAQFVGALYVLGFTTTNLVFCGIVAIIGTIVMMRIDRTATITATT